MLLLYTVCGALFLAVTVLTVKLLMIRRSMNEILSCLEEHLTEDINAPILISSGDRYVRRLAGELNGHLRALRRLRRQYLTGDRELKEAVTNISHDLRTPLTALCGYLDLLDREEMGEDAVRYVRQIRGRAEAMRQLTEELFRYSVLSSQPALIPERVDLCRSLAEVMASFYGAFAERKILPDIRLPDAAVIRQLNAAAVRRVFENVIVNAVKYSDGDFAVTLTEDGVITFANTAKGLSSVEVGKLFDRFYTVDSARKSTGLGLSIAKLLVERMEGAITADYREGKLFIQISF